MIKISDSSIFGGVAGDGCRSLVVSACALKGGGISLSGQGVFVSVIVP